MADNTKSSHPVTCIAAMDLNRGIGKNNALPWPALRVDLEFLLTTLKEVKDKRKKNAVLYGRRTWESIPADQRIFYSYTVNVIISQSLRETPDGANYVWPSVKVAVEMLLELPLAETIEQIFVVGGSGVYKEAIESRICERVYLTHVMDVFDTDVYFPEFDENVYKLTRMSPGDPSAPPQGVFQDNGIKFKFCVYEKKVATPSSVSN